ncbi:MAG: hypothetical protein IJ638_02560 [Alphaproteobacteria bacterium]|nr:hypothetical protein [Alphaproteobacteria bacterium]
MLLRKNDSGRSIVEMLGVLAIMGVITVMGISGYSQAIGKINRNNVVEQVTKLAQETRGVFAGRTSYNQKDTDENGGYDIGTNILTKMGLKLETPYGGTYTVTSVNSTGKNPGFKIEIPNVATQDCLYFTTMSWMDTLDNKIENTTNSAYAANSCPTDGVDTISIYFR